MVKKKLVRPNQDPKINVRPETKKKLDELKKRIHPRATYDEVIDNVASMALVQKAQVVKK